MIEIPGYEIKNEIGAGGMANVYLALHTSLEREVALKVMTPSLAADPNFSKRFLQEARTLASLAHPNIVAVYDVGITPNQLHYFSMQYLPNGDFISRVSKKLDQHQLIQIITGIAQALSYVHQRGYVHRDVAPSNILFDVNNNPVLTDFGIALAASQSARVTSAGFSVGTSHYMSPEQARGGEIDARADIYSLGVLVFYGLTGKPPYDGIDGFAVAYAHVYEPIPRLPAKYAVWQSLIDRALAKDPKDRYADIEQFQNGLAAITAPAAPIISETASDNPAAKPGAAKLQEVIQEPLEAVALKSEQPLENLIPNLAQTLPAQRRIHGLVLGVILLLLGAGLIGAAWYWPFAKPNLMSTPTTATSSNPLPSPTITPMESVSTPSVKPVVEVPQDAIAHSTIAEALATAEPIADAVSSATTATVIPSDIATVDTTDANAAPDTTTLSPEQPLDLANLPTVVDPVAEAIRLARIDLASQRLTTPSGNNAFEHFSFALKLDPKNKSVKKGIVDIAQKYLDLAERAQANDDWTAFAQYLDRTTEVAKTLVDAQSVLKSAQQLRTKRIDQWLAEAKTAVTVWDAATAKTAYQNILLIESNNTLAREGLAKIDKIGELGYVFHDPLSHHELGPELVILSVGKLAIMRHEVTRGEFRQFWSALGNRLFTGKEPVCRDRESLFRSSGKRNWENPDIKQDDNHPVVCVSWEEAVVFAKWLSKETGKRYRLPTPNEWDSIASRAPAGDCKNANLADAAFKREFNSRQGSDCDDGYATTAPVDHFEASSNRVYDIDGNVREWVGACGNGTMADAITACRDFMVKGRGWLSSATKETVTTNNNFASDIGLNSVGFRLVREIEK